MRGSGTSGVLACRKSMSKLVDFALWGALAGCALYWPLENAVARHHRQGLAAMSEAAAAAADPPLSPSEQGPAMSEPPPVGFVSAGISRLPTAEPIATLHRTTLRTNRDPMAVRVALLPGYDVGAHAVGGLARINDQAGCLGCSGVAASSQQP